MCDTCVRQPQSCNLERMYYKALPPDKALSHSGPPWYGSTASSVAAAGEDTARVISFTSRSRVHSVHGTVNILIFFVIFLEAGMARQLSGHL